jgi:CubicO group peptidase (beta-lactamase class C family)
MSSRTRSLSFAALVAAAFAAGAGQDAAATVPPPHPGSSWQKVAPSRVGLNANALNQIAQTAEQGKSNCLVVVRYGKIAGEWYWGGTTPSTTQDVYSMTKSVSSTLVGIAQDEGKLKVGDSASRWIPRWRGTPAAAVKVRDLLSMDSGRQWSFLTDYVSFLHATNRTAFAVGLSQQHKPGQVWAYNNAAVQTLQPVLQGATDRSVTGFATAKLFKPLGMSRTRMTTDPAGNAQMFEGVQSTCRDMARFGVMMLGHGHWGKKQIVSSSWITRATGPSSTKLNAGYGYLWWLNHYGVLASPESATSLSHALNPSTKKGRIAPGAPDDLYWALGLGNQLVQVDPASQIVVVRLGTPEISPKPPTFGPAQASRVVTQAVVHKRS